MRLLRSSRPIEAGRLLPIALAQAPTRLLVVRGSVLVLALGLAGCASGQGQYQAAAAAQSRMAVAVPVPVPTQDLEDDGLPAQVAPPHRAAHEADDPNEPFSPNYGRPAGAATGLSSRKADTDAAPAAESSRRVVSAWSPQAVGQAMAMARN